MACNALAVWLACYIAPRLGVTCSHYIRINLIYYHFQLHKTRAGKSAREKIRKPASLTHFSKFILLTFGVFQLLALAI